MVKRKIPKRIVHVVRNYRDRIERETQTPVEQVILYGSWAKGTPRKWSDIDVCMISPKFRDPLAAIMFLLQQRSKEEVLAGIEPVGFTPQDFEEGSSLINEIKRTGVDLASLPFNGDYKKLRKKLFAGKEGETLDRGIQRFNQR